jgi:hypothetical protein
MALSTLSKETKQIYNLTAERNMFTRSKSRFKQAISKIDLSMSLISKDLLKPTRTMEKIRRTALITIIK